MTLLLLYVIACVWRGIADSGFWCHKSPRPIQSYNDSHTQWYVNRYRPFSFYYLIFYLLLSETLNFNQVNLSQVRICSLTFANYFWQTSTKFNLIFLCPELKMQDLYLKMQVIIYRILFRNYTLIFSYIFPNRLEEELFHSNMPHLKFDIFYVIVKFLNRLLDKPRHCDYKDNIICLHLFCNWNRLKHLSVLSFPRVSWVYNRLCK